MSLEMQKIEELIGNQNAMIAAQNRLITQQSKVMAQLLEATSAILEALEGPVDEDEEQDNFGYDLSGKPIRN